MLFRSVSNTDVYQEFSYLMQTFKMSKDDVYKILNNSVNHAFVSENEKKKLKELLDERFEKFYTQINH